MKRKICRTGTGLLSLSVVLMNFATGVAGQTANTRVGPRRSSEQIKTFLSRLEGFGFSGSVLVAKNGKVLVESSHGLANKENRLRWSADTIYDVGSLTKQFTAAAILVLESDGKLHVEDPISKHFSDVPSDKFGITIHSLLTHTSGMTNGLGGDYDRISREEIIRQAMASKLESTPGTRHAYSNLGYSLLAAIVEIVSGQKYDAFLRERLFSPAGMVSTGYFPDQSPGKIAQGYRNGEYWGDGVTRSTAVGGDFWNLIGNGGVQSTPADMYRWMTAIEDGNVLSAAAREKIFKPHVQVYADYQRSGTPLHYAYGWYVWKLNGKPLIFHLGGNNIFNAAVRYRPDDRSVIVYGSNVSEFHDPNYPVPAIEKMLAGETVEMPPVVRPIAESKLREFAGRFSDPAGSTLEVTFGRGVLKLEGEGEAALSFVASGEWRDDPERLAMSRRTAQIVENSRTGKYESILSHYGPSIRLAELAEFEGLFWKKRFDRYGNYKATRVLGTLPLQRRGFIGRSIVAIDFERGTTYREYLWTAENMVGDVGPIDAPPSGKFFFIGMECFARIELVESLKTSRLCFVRRNSAVIQLTVKTTFQNPTLSKL